MKKVFLDCTKITTKEQLHGLLAKELAFPSWYGGNLDALHDCLTGLREETRLILTGWKALRERLGEYAVNFVYVLHCSSEENPLFQVELEE